MFFFLTHPGDTHLLQYSLTLSFVFGLHLNGNIWLLNSSTVFTSYFTVCLLLDADQVVYISAISRTFLLKAPAGNKIQESLNHKSEVVEELKQNNEMKGAKMLHGAERYCRVELKFSVASSLQHLSHYT